MARILMDAGYLVTFVYGSGTPVSVSTMLKKHFPQATFAAASSEAGLKEITLNKDLFINISFMDYSYGYAKRNIYYVHFPTKLRTGLFNYVLRFFAATGVHTMLPLRIRERIEDRLRAGVYPDMHKRLDSYQVFVVHSKFVQKWVKKYWNKDAVVLYPPVDLPSHSDMPGKKNWIVSVGRFFTLGHGKRQDVLIEAFRKLYDRGFRDWELHLVGGMGTEPSSVRFMNTLKKDASDYSVHFHVNASRHEVEEVLSRSRIYWHAAGFGINEEREPVRMEHFGIAPVEAIAAGCVPLLYAGGGLPEIIDKVGLKRDQHTFRTIEELVVKTESLIRGGEPLGRVNVDRFSASEFRQRFRSLIA